MDDLIEKMISLNTWAVAGSTHNPDKFAYKVYTKLKSMKYTVYSLNPSLKDVDEDKSYGHLNEIPDSIDVISMVINPVKGRDILKEAHELGVRYVWFQPGAESSELIELANQYGIEAVYGRCVLIELG